MEHCSEHGTLRRHSSPQLSCLRSILTEGDLEEEKGRLTFCKNLYQPLPRCFYMEAAFFLDLRPTCHATTVSCLCSIVTASRSLRNSSYS